MSEHYPECERLKKLHEKHIEELERKGVKLYSSVKEQQAGISNIDMHAKTHALLKYPIMLKCLSLTELEHYKYTNELPTDISSRLEKQVAEDQAALKPEDTEVVVNQKRVKFFQLFPEIEQQLSLEEIEKFRRTGDLPQKVFDKHGHKIIEYLVNSFPSF